MGIPVFFRKIMDDYSMIISDTIENVFVLCFDANGIYHDISTQESKDRTYNPNHPERHERALCNGVKKYIYKSIGIHKPKHVLICADGSAPLAKMKQQAQRRYKGPFDEQLRNQAHQYVNEPLPAPTYNRNNISPATNLIMELNNTIHQIGKELADKGITAVVSDSSEAGEGEHKIFNYIKQHYASLKVDDEDSEKTEKILIAGLDADLLMLALASPLRNIYLMRRNQDDLDYNPYHSTSYMYVDMPLFRNLFISEVRNEINQMDGETAYQKESDDSIIDDYIFMCYMLGNDFIPHSPTLSIKDGGIKRLISMYIDVFNQTKKRLVTVSFRHNPTKIGRAHV